MALPLTNFVNSITQELLFGPVVDNFYEGNVLWMRLRNKKKSWSTGRRLLIPVEVEGRTALGSYSGMDAFDTNQEDVRQQFQVDPSQYYANMSVSGIQAAANKGKQGVVDVISAELQSVGTALPQDIGDDLYLDGTGNNSKALTGLVSHVDDSTNVTTYQGLSRDTYTTLRSTLTAQAGALSLANIAADYDAAQRGSDAPSIFVTTPAVFTIYEALLTPTVANNFNPTAGRQRLTAAGLEGGGAVGNQGFPALAFRGVPFISDDKCTAANLYTLNENWLDLYEMAPSGEFVNGSKEGFAWTGWKKSANQDAIVSQLLWYGQLVGTNPRMHARRTGITS
jgi:hypothetical protein